MTKLTSWTRTGLLAVILAMVGFSYSLATSNSDVSELGGRAVGQVGSLAFANPFVGSGSTDRDLGDVLTGAPVARLARAKGGVAPYSFTSVAAGTLVLPSSLKLLLSGLVTGTAPTTAGSYRFNITVTDCETPIKANAVTETFRLSVINTTQFRFGTSRLSDGIQFQAYSDSIALLNGKPPFVFTVTNVTANGAKTSSGTLADVGLGIAGDGSIYGVPTTSGNISFNVSVKDSSAVVAASRNGTGNSQTLTLNVLANTLLNSNVVASSIVVKQGVPTKRGPADSFSYKGVINLNGQGLTALSGQSLSLRIGLETFAVGTFDGRGSIKVARGVVPPLGAKVTTSGAIAIADRNDTIAVSTDTLVGVTVVLPVEVRIGGSIVGSELLTFKVDNKKGTTLTYKAGTQTNVGGSAILTKVQGADTKDGTGDVWKVGFLAFVPQSLNASVSGAADVNINIGTGFSADLPVAIKNNKVSGKGSKVGTLASFSWDTAKGKGAYATNTVLSEPIKGSNIPLASAGKTSCYSNTVGLKKVATDKTALVGFENGLTIFPKRNKYDSTVGK